MERDRSEAQEMLTGRQKEILVGALLLVVVATSPYVLYGLVRHTTSERSECLSCHNEIQGTEFWAQSDRHRPSISCLQCHSASDGFFATDVSKYSDLVNFNCIECHRNAMERNATVRVKVFLPSKSKTYLWTLSDMYKWHVGKKTATCVDCHHNIAHKAASDKTYYPIIEYCAGCHYHARKDDYVRVEPLPPLIILGKK